MSITIQPPDLEALGPRQFARARLMFDGTRKFLTIPGLVMTLLVGVGALVSWQVITLEDRYGSEARVTMGRVEKLYTRVHTHTDSDGHTTRTTRYVIEYRFTPAGGTEMSGKDDLNEDAWRALREDGPVEIEYLPGEVDHNRPTVARMGGGAYLVLLLPGLALTGALVTLGIARARAGRTYRLLDQGRSVAAVVASKTPNPRMRVNRRPIWRVTYRFTDADGQERTFESNEWDMRVGNALEAGDAVAVVYDREDPTRCQPFRERWRKLLAPRIIPRDDAMSPAPPPDNPYQQPMTRR